MRECAAKYLEYLSEESDYDRQIVLLKAKKEAARNESKKLEVKLLGEGEATYILKCVQPGHIVVAVCRDLEGSMGVRVFSESR